MNADTASLREQVGRRIGIAENLTEPSSQADTSSFRGPTSATPVAGAKPGRDRNRNQLFHRQGEPGIEQAHQRHAARLPRRCHGDRAAKRAQLRDAQRRLSRASVRLEAAELVAQTMDVELRALANEARAAGLTTVSEAAPASELLAALQIARQAAPEVVPTSPDAVTQDRRLALEEQARQSRSGASSAAGRSTPPDGRLRRRSPLATRSRWSSTRGA